MLERGGWSSLCFWGDPYRALGLLASAVAVALLPLNAQDGSADDLGVMSISLKDVVKPRVGFQGALQGAGTPNSAQPDNRRIKELRSSQRKLKAYQQ